MRTLHSHTHALPQPCALPPPVDHSHLPDKRRRMTLLPVGLCACLVMAVCASLLVPVSLAAPGGTSATKGAFCTCTCCVNTLESQTCTGAENGTFEVAACDVCRPSSCQANYLICSQKNADIETFCVCS